MTQRVAELAAATDEVERTYVSARTDLADRFPGVDPTLIREPNGRYVLLDALTTIVAARASLAAAQQ